MATSGRVFPIHSFDFSKPENTLFQYGSSARPLSSAAPIAGTCEDPTPAMILATVHFRFAEDLDLGLELALDLAAGVFLFALPAGAERMSAPDLLRLPSTVRPPASIILA